MLMRAPEQAQRSRGASRMVSSHARPRPRNRQLMSAPSLRESERPLVDGSGQLLVKIRRMSPANLADFRA
jgi:hypothetical protein